MKLLQTMWEFLPERPIHVVFAVAFLALAAGFAVIGVTS